MSCFHVQCVYRTRTHHTTTDLCSHEDILLWVWVQHAPTVDTPRIGTKALVWLGTSFWSVIIRVDELWGLDVINRYCEWHPVPTPLDQALLIIVIFLKLDKTSRSHSFWGHKNHNGSSPLPQPSQPLPTSDDPPMAPWWWAFHVHNMLYGFCSCTMLHHVAPCCTRF